MVLQVRLQHYLTVNLHLQLARRMEQLNSFLRGVVEDMLRCMGQRPAPQTERKRNTTLYNSRWLESKSFMKSAQVIPEDYKIVCDLRFTAYGTLKDEEWQSTSNRQQKAWLARIGEWARTTIAHGILMYIYSSRGIMTEYMHSRLQKTHDYKPVRSSDCSAEAAVVAEQPRHRTCPQAQSILTSSEELWSTKLT